MVASKLKYNNNTGGRIIINEFLSGSPAAAGCASW